MTEIDNLVEEIKNLSSLPVTKVEFPHLTLPYSKGNFYVLGDKFRFGIKPGSIKNNYQDLNNFNGSTAVYPYSLEGISFSKSEKIFPLIPLYSMFGSNFGETKIDKLRKIHELKQNLVLDLFMSRDTINWDYDLLVKNEWIPFGSASFRSKLLNEYIDEQNRRKNFEEEFTDLSFVSFRVDRSSRSEEGNDLSILTLSGERCSMQNCLVTKINTEIKSKRNSCSEINKFRNYKGETEKGKMNYLSEQMGVEIQDD